MDKNKQSFDTGATGDLLDLEAFLPYRLAVLSHQVSASLGDLYADRFGLSIPEWRVMAILGRHPNATANVIAEQGAMDKVQVSRAVSRLSSAGILDREIDGRDRRRIKLRLSRSGERIYRAIVPLARGYEAELLAGLSVEDRRGLARILAALSARALTLAAR